jgi:hypothetical protein
MGADEDNSFEYRRAITIDHTKVDSTCGSNDILHFPVLITLSNQTWLKKTVNGGKIYNVTNVGGFDIPCDLIFRASNGRTQLDHEIEKYDGTNGSLIAWVRIPALSKTADTRFTLLRKLGITTTINPQRRMIRLFCLALKEDPSGDLPDARQQGSNHGLSRLHGPEDQISAKANGGIDLDGAGSDYINATNSSGMGKHLLGG